MNRALPVAAAAAALVIAGTVGALAAVQAQHLSDANQLAAARDSALHQAQQIAVDIASYDYRHIDADFATVTNESTGAFKTEFVTQAASVRDAIVSGKAISVASVARAGIVDYTTGSAHVDVALNRIVTNASAPKGTQAAFGVEMTLVRIHDRWMVSAVTPL
jgi:Mce-associated membrane protein